MDAAFDEPGGLLDITSPFEAAPEGADLPGEPILEGLDEILEELTGRKPETSSTELPPAPSLDEPKATLNMEDIEALFEE